MQLKCQTWDKNAIIAIKILLKYCICRYETSINEVSEELERMRAKVAELLEENNRLPEAERMDVHEFELDVEEQQRRGRICILKLLFT